MKCDILPYRTFYFDHTCFFAIINSEKGLLTVGQARSLCSKAMPSAKLTQPSEDISQQLFLKTSDFVVDNSTTARNKIALCSFKRGLQCSTEEFHEKVGGKCVLKAQEKMAYPDAVDFCTSRGSELPIVHNVVEKTKLYDSERTSAVWLGVSAEGKGWPAENPHTWHTTCTVDKLPPPKELSSYCDDKFAEVLNNQSYTSVAGQSELMDVICIRESASYFWTVKEPPRPSVSPEKEKSATSSPTEKPDNDGCDGRWSEWQRVDNCATTCGSCSVSKRKRVCNTTCGCCKGEAEDIGPCGIALCPFPGKPCCLNFKKSMNFRTLSFFCGLDNPAEYPPNCAPLPAVRPLHKPTTTTTTTSTSTSTTTPTTTTTTPTTTTTTTPEPTTTTARACCPPGGIWSDWTTIGPCSASCGSCHNATRKRTCKSMFDGSGCPCTGVAKDIGPCGIALCSFPTNTCCFSYVKSLNYQQNYFFCGMASVPVDPWNNCLPPTTTTTTTRAPTTTTTKATTTTTERQRTLFIEPEEEDTTTTTTKPVCTDGNGKWSEWTTIGRCATTCGSCNVAKRKRVCNTTCGCCKGEATDIGPCGIALCIFPANTCCFSYVKSLNYRTNSFFCGMDSVRLYVDDCSGATVPYNQHVIQNPVTEATKPAACTDGKGRWSEWTTIGSCPTTCGSCNVAKRKRVCNTTCGCCPGEASDIGPCGIALCPFPANTCCKSYVKSLNYRTNSFFCGMDSVRLYPDGC